MHAGRNVLTFMDDVSCYVLLRLRGDQDLHEEAFLTAQTFHDASPADRMSGGGS